MDNKCKKCGLEDNNKIPFFTVFSKRDFCINCVADILENEGIYIFSSRGPNGRVLHTEDESSYIWNTLGAAEKQNVAKVLAFRLSRYRTVKDMNQDRNRPNARRGETKDVNELTLDKDFFKEFYGGLMSHLNDRVIGQEDLKRKMCYVFSRFMAKLTVAPQVDISNILVVGQSGTGKTETVRAVRQHLKTLDDNKLRNIPFVEVDASSLTPSSYKGLNVADGIFKAAMDQVNSPQDLENGGAVIYLDEFDKLFTTADSQKSTVAREILKIMEGGDYSWVERDMGMEKTVTINTKNFLFICSGAFSKLTKDLNQKKSGGISLTRDVHSKNETVDAPSVKDLLKFGVPNEVLGRLPIKARTHKLTEEDYFRILTEVKGGVIDKGEDFLKAFGVSKKVSRDLLKEFAKKASEGQLGARELKTRVEEEVERLIHEYAINTLNDNNLTTQ